MKRHLIGILAALMTFVGGFWASPIAFSRTGVGSGFDRSSSESFCRFSTYGSTHLERLILFSCLFYTEREAADDLAVDTEKEVVVSAPENRYEVSYSIEGRDYYCALRQDGIIRNNICSADLDDIREFERQVFGE